MPFESTRPCGCKAWFTGRDGVLHTKACNMPGHEATLDQAVYEIALKRGMAVAHVTDPPERKPS